MSDLLQGLSPAIMGNVDVLVSAALHCTWSAGLCLKCWCASYHAELCICAGGGLNSAGIFHIIRARQPVMGNVDILASAALYCICPAVMHSVMHVLQIKSNSALYCICPGCLSFGGALTSAGMLLIF